MKILDGEFRKSLYKSLVEAGYEKQEAQRLIGVKYNTALRDNVKARLQNIVTLIDSDDFEQATVALQDIGTDVNEIAKLKEVLAAKE